jgi:hypothetical protein
MRGKSIPLRDGEVRVNTTDGVIIETKGTRLCDLFQVVKAAACELQDRLEEVDDEKLGPDDVEVLDALSTFAEDVLISVESAGNWVENHAAEATWFWKDKRK